MIPLVYEALLASALSALLMTAPQRFFFVHLLKTGGTELFLRLGGNPAAKADHPYPFSEAEIYPNRTDGDVMAVAPQMAPWILLERWKVRREEIRIIMGHFPLCTVELLDAPFTTLTVLREPVERTLSYLRHHRTLSPEDRDKSFEEIYHDELRFPRLVHNHMVKMLSLTTDRMTRGMLTTVDLTNDDLARACENLEKLDAFGLQERFEDFCRQLEHRFGWRLGAPGFSNRTAPAEIPQSLIKQIRKDNALDVALYEHAVSLHEQRGRR